MTVHETEHCNRLRIKRLEPETQRQQPFAKGIGSEFESLPPSHLTADPQQLTGAPFRVSTMSPRDWFVMLWNVPSFLSKGGLS